MKPRASLIQMIRQLLWCISDTIGSFGSQKTDWLRIYILYTYSDSGHVLNDIEVIQD